MTMPDPADKTQIQPDLDPSRNVPAEEDEGGVDINLDSLPEEAKKKIQTLSAQRGAHKDKRLKAEEEARVAKQERDQQTQRAVAAEAELARLRNPAPPKQDAPADSSKKDDSEWKSRVDLLEFRIAHRDLSTDALEELSSIAKGKGVSLEDALKTPVWQAYSEMRKQEAEKSSAALHGKSASDRSIPTGELTAEQKSVAARMGVSEESYKRTLAKRSEAGK